MGRGQLNHRSLTQSLPFAYSPARRTDLNPMSRDQLLWAGSRLRQADARLTSHAHQSPPEKSWESFITHPGPILSLSFLGGFFFCSSSRLRRPLRRPHRYHPFPRPSSPCSFGAGSPAAADRPWCPHRATRHGDAEARRRAHRRGAGGGFLGDVVLDPVS